MRRFQKATIRDVAARAGVSTSTVSYFVSGRQDVCSAETAERIRAAVAELHYTPNSLSQGLRRSSTRTLGLCMIAPYDLTADDGSFYLERIWRGVMREVGAQDYSLLYYPPSVRESGSSNVFLDGRVDGLLLYPHSDLRQGRAAAAGMPTVLVTRSLALPSDCGAVWADETRTMDLALSHLWDLGHRRIGHLPGPVGGPEAGGEPRDDIAAARRDAYVAWMQARDAFAPALLGQAGSWNGKRAPEALAVWREQRQPPTAVVCANDRQALDLIEAARAVGVSVPGDLSVIGVDNSPAARDRRPALTSVDVPLEEVGAQSVQALLRLMRGAPLEQCRIAVPVGSLVVRASTAPPPQK